MLFQQFHWNGNAKYDKYLIYDIRTYETNNIVKTSNSKYSVRTEIKANQVSKRMWTFTAPQTKS